MEAPAGLGERGVALWSVLDAGLDLAGASGVLAHEACRIADRLERLDDFLTGRGREWISFAERWESEGSVQVTVKVDNTLGESRQQQGRLAHLLSQLGVEAAPKKAVPAPGEQKSGGTVLDELKAKRESGGSAAGAAGPAGAGRGRAPRKSR